jgi:hypothetical protein
MVRGFLSSSSVHRRHLNQPDGDNALTGTQIQCAAVAAPRGQ